MRDRSVGSAGGAPHCNYTKFLPAQRASWIFGNSGVQQATYVQSVSRPSRPPRAPGRQLVVQSPASLASLASLTFLASRASFVLALIGMGASIARGRWREEGRSEGCARADMREVGCARALRGARKS